MIRNVPQELHDDAARAVRHGLSSFTFKATSWEWNGFARNGFRYVDDVEAFCWTAGGSYARHWDGREHICLITLSE